MGANATTFVPAYVAGEVLTAADLTVTNSGVPVFADATARDAGFGGTGEKVLAEGQLCYLESTNVVQYYDGAVWATVGPATAGALVYITGASFSAVTSVSLPTSTFTATYANYLVQWDFTASSSAGLTVRMRVGGADNSTNSYSSNGIWYGNGGTSGNFASSSASSFAWSGGSAGTAGRRNTTNFTLYGPQLTQFTGFTATGSGGNLTGTEIGGYSIGGNFEATTSFDAISFIIASGTITGSYRVFGYVNS
jgi:hypothetical protein